MPDIFTIHVERVIQGRRAYASARLTLLESLEADPPAREAMVGRAVLKAIGRLDNFEIDHAS